jgi:ABC-2 type transport system permease protein
MIERIRVIMRKELIQTLHEPRMRFMLILPPIIQLIIFGFAANMDVDHARLAWMDFDRTQESRRLLSEMEGSGRFHVVATPEHDQDMQRLLDHGDVDAVVRVLPGFARDILRGRPAEVQVLVDGSNSNTASIVAGYATQTAARFSREAVQAQQQSKLVGRTTTSGGPVHANIPSVKSQTRVWFNQDLKSRNYFVPGVVVNIIMLITLSLTSMAIVREKEIGTMEQLMVTPLRPMELILGKCLPFVGIGLFDAALAVGVALLMFKVPFRGSFLVLLFSCILFLMTTLGAGLFISTISRTQQQAMMATFLFFQPCFLLSGFSFPIRNIPDGVRWLTYLNPVRYFLEIVRGIFLKGSGIDVLWPQMIALAVIGTAVLTMSTLRFHKKLD